MKVSIITTCKNSAATIEDTIKSVISQDYTSIEYIVIDGQSVDGTIQIIQKYRDNLSVFLSESDHGFYYALNKGISLATGEVIGILNSDDFYPSSTIISNVIDVFTREQADAVYGDLSYVDRIDTSKVIRKWVSGKYTDGDFLGGWMPPHPTFFVKKSVYTQFGVFNTGFKSAADYEIMLRFIHKHKIKLAYLPELIVLMRIGGTSNVSLANRIKANLEDRNAWTINGLTPRPWTLFLKPLRKIRQFFY